jgi:hypothetical protein
MGKVLPIRGEGASYKMSHQEGGLRENARRKKNHCLYPSAQHNSKAENPARPELLILTVSARSGPYQL